jgi:hypothetical protein
VIDLTGNDIGGYTVLTRFYKKELVPTPEGPRALVTALRHCASSQAVVHLHSSRSLNDWVEILLAAATPANTWLVDDAEFKTTGMKRQRDVAEVLTVAPPPTAGGGLPALSGKLESRPTPHRFSQCLGQRGIDTR